MPSGAAPHPEMEPEPKRAEKHSGIILCMNLGDRVLEADAHAAVVAAVRGARPVPGVLLLQEYRWVTLGGYPGLSGLATLLNAATLDEEVQGDFKYERQWGSNGQRDAGEYLLV